MSDDQYDPLVQDQTLLNEVKFAARDFSSMADDLLRRLKLEYGDVYNDYASTSQGIMLRDLVAWGYAALIWYLDRTASDGFLQTSRTRSAVERIVEQIAYKMSAAAAASTILTLTFPDGTDEPFTMKERWKYNGPNGLFFESYAKITQGSALAAGDTISVSARQGESRTLTYTSDGTTNQTYRLSSIEDGRYLGEGTTEVWVDSQLWAEKDFLEFSQDDPNHYEVSYLASPPVIRFGDGNAGAVPPLGAEVKIRFLIIDGISGNVKKGTIQSSVDALTISGSSVSFEVNNDVRASGGTEPELAEHAKRWAPVSFAARGAAITQPDYEALSNTFSDPSYGSVAKAYAINPRSSYEDTVFNGLVTDIEDILSDFNVESTSIESSINVSANALSTLLSVLTVSVTSLQSLRDEMIGWIGSISTVSSTIRDAAASAEIRSGRSSLECSTASGILTDLRSWVEQNVSNTSDREHVLDNLDLAIPSIDLAKKESDTATTHAGEILSAVDSTLTPNVGNLTDALEDGGDVDTLLLSQQSSADSITVEVASIQSDAGEMQGNAQSVYDESTSNVDEMQSRIGDLFSDDCLSNFVQVPILSLDTEGNYVAPSIGLRAGLQEYLESIKEVTQVIEVTDGSSSLLSAVIMIKMSILSSYVPAEVVSRVRAVITKALKGRDFNQPLYLSEPDSGLGLYDLLGGIDGIDFVNIQITGPSDNVDSDGNLGTSDKDRNKVITSGSLNIVGLDGEEIV